MAVDEHRFLVLERDGRVGLDAAFKQLFLIDIEGASDIRGVPALPATGIPAGITPVAKGATPFLDLVAALGGPSAAIPEKFEGLAFGPDLPDGRHLLLVTVDNDFSMTRDNLVYAFAVDPDDLPDFVPQRFENGSCRGDDEDAQDDR